MGTVKDKGMDILHLLSYALQEAQLTKTYKQEKEVSKCMVFKPVLDTPLGGNGHIRALFSRELQKGPASSGEVV